MEWSVSGAAEVTISGLVHGVADCLRGGSVVHDNSSLLMHPRNGEVTRVVDLASGLQQNGYLSHTVTCERVAFERTGDLETRGMEAIIAAKEHSRTKALGSPTVSLSYFYNIIHLAVII